MEKLLRYFLSLTVTLLIFSSCIKLSNERFRHLSIDEKRALSAEYTQLAKRLEAGSPKNMELLDKAIRINPNNDLAWREKALPYLYAGLYDEWNSYIQKAVELNPEAWQAWRGYDRLFYLRDYAGALFDLDATDTLTRDQVDYPQNTSVDFLRGLCYYGLNDLPKAVEYFEAFIDDESMKLGEAYIDETVFLYLGLIAMKQGKYTQAILHLKRGIAFEKSYADFNFHLARIYCILDELELANSQLIIAKNKFIDGNYLRGYRYEAIDQIYMSDINEFEKDLEFSLEVQA